MHSSDDDTPLAEIKRRFEKEEEKLKEKGYRVYSVRGNHKRPCSVCDKQDWVKDEKYVYPFPYAEGAEKYCFHCAMQRFCASLAHLK
jgi:hypothetical protein|tara:strand:- start:567 stop:827 length:261 start_codon:yes stop_codon:yes gene_type:complete